MNKDREKRILIKIMGENRYKYLTICEIRELRTTTQYQLLSLKFAVQDFYAAIFESIKNPENVFWLLIILSTILIGIFSVYFWHSLNP